jgi:precorrin-2 dehydrogenase/sirohydrochlorin ferrochelatase
MYPMMLDVSDRQVVIVGAGLVAARKAAGLVQSGARRVRCVAPEFHPGIPQSVERVVARYEPSHLDDAALAFAATNDASVNAAVVRDARARGILVNRAGATEDESAGDFTIPAEFHEAGIVLTVSAGGSPALARMIRSTLQQHWDPRWSRAAAAMSMLRPEILGRDELPEEKRRQIFRWFASPEAMDLLAGLPVESDVDADVAALRSWIRELFPELKCD